MSAADYSNPFARNRRTGAYNLDIPVFCFEVHIASDNTYSVLIVAIRPPGIFFSTEPSVPANSGYAAAGES
jgi:hypothetical protein